MQAKKVSSKELIRNFGELSDDALREPVVITKNGRDRLVLLSMEEYERLGERTNPTQESDPRQSSETRSFA